LPVKYSGTLKETLFAEEYGRERSRIFLDNFNLLYVALTRAEKGLFVIAPDLSVPRIFKTSIARILYDSIDRSPILSTKWTKATKSWIAGKIDTNNEEENRDSVATFLKNYNTGSWRAKLIVKHTPHSSDLDDQQRKKINFGIHLHAAFAKVNYAHEIPTTISQLESDGVIHADEKEMLTQQMDKLMSNPQVADWFSDRWEVRNEAHALLPNGIEYRIDRLLLKGKQAIVIDFKTGAQKKEDHKQIGEYCNMLSLMGLDAEGYLLYLTDGEVVSVVPPKISKKKNVNQLGLDF
jgi:ATP-dependent exoDNAse (exonuclease V) beta subunit